MFSLELVRLIVASIGVIVAVKSKWFSEHKAAGSAVVILLLLLCLMAMANCSSSETFTSSQYEDGVRAENVDRDGEISLTGNAGSADSGISNLDTDGGVQAGSTGESLNAGMPSYYLFEHEPADGTRNIKAIDESVSGEIYRDVICFNVSAWSESEKRDSITYLNNGNYDTFSGIFYSCKLQEGRGANTVQYVIKLDDATAFGPVSLSKLDESISFNLDISTVRQIEIVCYYMEGSTGGLLGVAGTAYGRLADAVFTKG